MKQNNCNQTEMLLSDYLDGELSRQDAEGVREHLARCQRCRGRWEGLRRTVRLVAHLGNETCPVDLRDRVTAAVGAKRKTEAGWSFPAAPRIAWRSAAAGFAVVLVTAVAWRTLGLGTPSPSLSGRSAGGRTVAAAIRIHDQYELANGLGTTDGLLLSIPVSIAKPLPSYPDTGSARRVDH